ncbi:thiamine-phosphate kinase [Rhodocyclus tenuis]|uniref:thiamine-phosphate kinase n=1 Tax=Rhodocyclus tenuis TaxID=1066 RepID=UPI0019042678|nr:thiamine-phosphate kinase [Rhodocyclus tenuis]
MSGEFDLIRRHFARPTPATLLGPGDDCALLAPTPGQTLAITTDMLVAGVHFFADTDPGRLGWKTLAVNLSDLAAMGAQPRWATLAGALPEADDSWLGAFADGFFACATRYGVDLVGGDTTRGPLTLSVTAIGELPLGSALRRDGAHAGDDLWISGSPGLAALALAALQGRTALPATLAERCRDALETPTPRIELGLALRTRQLASAAIDVSDGLLADLGHILERSHLAGEVELAALPAAPADIDPALWRDCLLAGGDDYELIFAAAPAARAEIDALAQSLALPVTRFGRLLPGAETGSGQAPRLSVRDANGQPLTLTHRGYDHFA